MHDNRSCPEGTPPGEPAPVSMVILAGGKSSRMGRDKSDLILEGRTFLEIQMEKGRSLGISDILVSGYRGRGCPLPVIADHMGEKGPLGGLETCLRRCRFSLCLVVGIDTPLVPVEELRNLVEKGTEQRAAATILEHGGKQEPLLGIYRTDLADAMANEIKYYKGSVFAFLRRVGYAVYKSDAPEELFLNVNAPEAYAKALEIPKDPAAEFPAWPRW